MRIAIVGLIGVSLGLVCSGCTVSTTVNGYERADRLASARDRFVAQKAQCERIGGSMSLRSRPLEPPGITEYRSARCVRR